MSAAVPEPPHPGEIPVAHPALGPRRSALGTTWWGKAWVRALEEVAYTPADLRQARAIARSGDVGRIAVSRGGLGAQVGPSVVVAVRLPVLDADGVAALVEAVAAEPGRLPALLAGDLPHDLVEHADEAGVELLPYGAELDAACTCRAWASPCRHALAVLLQTTWLLEADPLVLLHLRGLPRDELLARVHALAAPGPDTALDAAAPDDDVALDAAVDAALRAGRLLEALDEPTREIDHLW